jgi:YNFM family putative membrane transporter
VERLAVRGPGRRSGSDERATAGMGGFLLGAAAMFAVTYSTQAILPALSAEFDVSPARAGLSISVVVVALGLGAWIWGPFSDRYGRKRSIVLASWLLVPPTVGAALAPTFPLLLAFRGLQGLCMPGLLTAGVPYVTEAFAPRIGGRAMGYYIAALVTGGLIGRLGVGLLAAAAGWRVAIGLLAALPAAAAVVMQRSLLDLPSARSESGRLRTIGRQLRNPRLLRATAVGTAFFFTFVGTFSYVVYRLERPPFSLGEGARSLVFVLWTLGVLGPTVGRLSDRLGWRRLALCSLALAAVGLALSLPAWLPSLVVGLACVTVGNFAGVTAAQIGVTGSTEVDRGATMSVYFSLYYLIGSTGAYLPGLAWERFGWDGVVATGGAALAFATIALVAGRR